MPRVKDTLICDDVELAFIVDMEGNIRGLLFIVNFDWYIAKVLIFHFQKVDLIDDLSCEFIDIENVGGIVLKFAQIVLFLQLFFRFLNRLSFSLFLKV